MNLKQEIKGITPPWALDLYFRVVAYAAAVAYGWPSRQIKVIGVTGTKGKSSTVALIVAVLKEAGFKVGWTSSVSWSDGARETANKLHMTMPGRFFLQRQLRRMVNEGCTHAVLEVTSEGIKQFRHKAIWFDVAVFTNLSPEHLEAHGGLNNYRAAKRELFAALKKRPEKKLGADQARIPRVSIVNLDSEHAPYFLGVAADHTIGFGVTTRSASGINELVRAEDLLMRPGLSTFSVRGVNFEIGLPGAFNVYNALAAIAVGLSQGVSLRHVQAALAGVKPPAGRMQFVEAGQPFKAVVDYAHTPDSLRLVYETLKANVPAGGRLIGVLGATGGGRDKWKRPVLGAIAEELCDEIVITNEDPYDEDPQDIMHAVLKGISRRDKARLEPDRRLAIRYACQTAKPRDTVVITGKGSEQTMIIEGRAEPWNDTEVVLSELRTLGFKNEQAMI